MINMAGKRKWTFHAKTSLLLILFYILTGTAGRAQEKDDTDLDIFGEIGFEYTDNVYHLTDGQITTMTENNPDDASSGRYQDMDSLSDYIIKPRIGIKWNSDSPFGGKLRVTSWFKYNYYLKNDDSDFPEGRIILKNSMGEKGSFILEGNFLFGFRKKNYLSGVNDLNGNGNISRDERTYSPALYDEYEGVAGYRYEYVKDKRRTLSGLSVRPFAGYSIRNYNSGFENRDRDTAFYGLELDIEFIDRIDLESSYEYENITSPGAVELVLYDETRSGLDVSNDGSIRANAPLYTSVDRSSNRYEFKIDPSVKLAKDITLFMGYSRRTTEYTSGNPLDTEHYDQKAHRKKYRAGIDYDYSKAWSLRAEYLRIYDEDPEDGVYKENNYLFIIRYKF